LDIVEISMTAPAPHGHQSENHLINPSYYWEKRGRATWQRVLAATDNVAGPLWSNGDSSYHGTNDKVDEAVAAGLGSSLLLIEPNHLRLRVAAESMYGGGSRRRVRAAFNYSGSAYNFVVSDPWVEARYFAGPNGEYAIAEARICVSLAEIINGIATKLVASVITPERAGE